jgi:hypothetical protein
VMEASSAVHIIFLRHLRLALLGRANKKASRGVRDDRKGNYHLGQQLRRTWQMRNTHTNHEITKCPSREAEIGHRTGLDWGGDFSNCHSTLYMEFYAAGEWGTCHRGIR